MLNALGEGGGKNQSSSRNFFVYFDVLKILWLKEYEVGLLINENPRQGTKLWDSVNNKFQIQEADVLRLVYLFSMDTHMWCRDLAA